MTTAAAAEYPERPIRLIVASAPGGQPDINARAKQNPGKLMYGSAGIGSSQHISMELFKLMTGTQLVHVPYKGIQQAITEIIGEHLHMVCDNASSIMPHLSAGRLRGVGVTGTKRIPVVPDLPTIAEAGVPGYEITPWGGYAVPAGTPKPIVARLNIELNKIVALPAIRERWIAVGIDPVGGTPEYFTQHVRKETAKWADVIKRTGAKVD